MSVRNLGNAQDVKSSQEAVSDQSGQSFLKIPDKRTPFYLLDLEYQDGFAHWVDLPNGRKIRVVCAGGADGGGFDPDNCEICAHVMNLYKQGKELRDDGQDVSADKLKKIANNMRGKYEAHFLAVRGEREIVKEGGKKKVSANFDIDDKDVDVEIGILGLSHSQFTKLTGLIGDDNVPHVSTGLDLGNRVIWSTKEKKAGKNKDQTFTEVNWSADAKKTHAPELEYDAESEELDITNDFDIDEEIIAKVYAQLIGDEAEEEVEVETDSEDVDDDFLEDETEADIVDDDDDDDEEDILDDVETDEDDEAEFDDDPLPEPTPKKSTTRKKTTATTTRKQPATGKKTGTTRRSGKAKL